MGETEATRAQRTKLPSGFGKLARVLNACQAECMPRKPHALELAFPLLGPSAPGGSATLGGVPFSMEHAYFSSRLPHAREHGAIAASTLVLGPPSGDGEVRVKLHLRVRVAQERAGFVTASQLLLERRMDQAVASPKVKSSVLWDVCEDAEMCTRRIELSESEGAI